MPRVSFLLVTFFGCHLDPSSSAGLLSCLMLVDVEDIRGVMGRGVELLRVDVGHRGANHRDEGSRGSAFGMLQPGC